MSGNMSGSSNQWLHFYQNNHPTTTALPTSWSGDPAADATVATTAGTTAIISNNQLNRVNRPRRRSRASRKPPTTLLNTDTANFRAMVQRFTGGNNNTTSADPFLSNDQSSSTTSTDHQLVFNNIYNHGVDSGVMLRPNDGYTQNQPYFSMAVNNGASLAGQEAGYDDQNIGSIQRGSYNW